MQKEQVFSIGFSYKCCIYFDFVDTNLMQKPSCFIGFN